MPKASAPGSRCNEAVPETAKASCTRKPSAWSCHSGGLAPTASVHPLASALGNPTRRDPGEAVRT